MNGAAANTFVLGTDGLMMEEECDLGVAFNTKDPTDYTVACTADCKVTNKNLWKCYWIEDKNAAGFTYGYHSKCDYLCGNKNVDRKENIPNFVYPVNNPGIPGMTISETCDKGV